MATTGFGFHPTGRPICLDCREVHLEFLNQLNEDSRCHKCQKPIKIPQGWAPPEFAAPIHLPNTDSLDRQDQEKQDQEMLRFLKDNTATMKLFLSLSKEDNSQDKTVAMYDIVSVADSQHGMSIGRLSKSALEIRRQGQKEWEDAFCEYENLLTELAELLPGPWKWTYKKDKAVSLASLLETTIQYYINLRYGGSKYAEDSELKDMREKPPNFGTTPPNQLLTVKKLQQSQILDDLSPKDAKRIREQLQNLMFFQYCHEGVVVVRSTARTSNTNN
ncbi:hypothetical protein BU26DRAFT_510035 [Trematosphaeria pertusa]|uniref:Uncharacterized protein n=1 Tax=Trematosphaeria pertusa TaxID=390896 RepID=A0A6A6I0K2_9PLEO|nr:uncharacterized protein BU26DRAFT_510035 [Trematosphaeria pertusa]KAF2243538.1 hypothetical protein BU26DRAFT_510035 [Trematosphaeria pertusa]